MTKNASNIKMNRDRRDFLKKTGMLLVGGAIGQSSIASPRMTSSQNVLRVGLIGCGGRGTGAALQALQADPNTVITAMGDVFEDRLEEAYAALNKKLPDRVKVPKERKFIGFDAYQKVVASDVDVVLLAAPPGFRPEHLKAAVNAKKHVFCEKPVAVDVPGIRTVLEAVEKAEANKLSIVSGFCFRYEFANRAIFQKILGGSIGDIKAVTTFRNGGELWYKDPQPDWTKMTEQMRNWYYYNWLSGDFIVEQAVHSLDMMSWAMGDVMPLSATGTGGRQARVDAKYGNIYDHFAVEYKYADGRVGTHFTRQQAGTTPRNTVDVIGSEGVANILVSSRHTIRGKEEWAYSGERNNMYQTQHDELFRAIREGKTIKDGAHMTNSTLLAIWGRAAAYTGLELTLEQMMSSQESLGPDPSAYSWDLKYAGPPIAIPGMTKFV